MKEPAVELFAADPKSITAIICKKKADVKELHQALQGIPGLHREGEMSFEPGVMVTNGHQVKGLEFTNVVLWDPAGTDYRHTAVDRNLLYVAITRACKRLDIVHWRTLARGWGQPRPENSRGLRKLSLPPLNSGRGGTLKQLLNA